MAKNSKAIEYFPHTPYVIRQTAEDKGGVKYIWDFPPDDWIGIKIDFNLIGSYGNSLFPMLNNWLVFHQYEYKKLYIHFHNFYRLSPDQFYLLTSVWQDGIKSDLKLSWFICDFHSHYFGVDASAHLSGMANVVSVCSQLQTRQIPFFCEKFPSCLESSLMGLGPKQFPVDYPAFHGGEDVAKFKMRLHEFIAHYQIWAASCDLKISSGEISEKVSYGGLKALQEPESGWGEFLGKIGFESSFFDGIGS